MKPSLPQGTRDFGPDIIAKRNFILDTIKHIFELHGYLPLETPAFENLTTLMGKYGDEGDKLIFKILNNGLDNIEKKEKTVDGFNDVLAGKNNVNITERALKYDLTIPFARYVAMNHQQLAMPFKRFQIQNVWRADRPQRGRYREFTQCDADVVGSNSILNEIELLQIYAAVFEKLNIKVDICVNHRLLLLALAQVSGKENNLVELSTLIDKLDKIGFEKMKTILQQLQYSEDAIEKISMFLNWNYTDFSNEEILQKLPLFFPENNDAFIAHFHINEILKACPFIKIDLSLARGLDYYTGSIFEVKPLNISMGSIGGGGRYDKLTELFGVKDISGVGISFGIDRIFDVMEEHNLFPENILQKTTLLMLNNGQNYWSFQQEILKKLRQENISCLFFPDEIKFDKQFKYADKKNIPFVCIIGETELQEKKLSIKNLQTGKQFLVEINEAFELLTQHH